MYKLKVKNKSSTTKIKGLKELSINTSFHFQNNSIMTTVFDNNFNRFTFLKLFIDCFDFNFRF